MVKQCHKPAMTRNGNHTNYKKWWWLGDCLWHCFTHINPICNHLRLVFKVTDCSFNPEMSWWLGWWLGVAPWQNGNLLNWPMAYGIFQLMGLFIKPGNLPTNIVYSRYLIIVRGLIFELILPRTIVLVMVTIVLVIVTLWLFNIAMV